jgi:hypothetical protein
VRQRIAYILLCLLSLAVLAAPQDDNTTPRGAAASRRAARAGQQQNRQQNQQQNQQQSQQRPKAQPKAQPGSLVSDDDIPDSLLHPRWPVQPTSPLTIEDADSSVLDLHMPQNLKR